MSRGSTGSVRARVLFDAAPSNRTTAFLVTALSLVGWLLWMGTRTVHHPWADLSRGSFTDHFSHMNAARVFPRVGAEIWRRGPKLFVPEVQGEALLRLPYDVRSGGSFTGGIYALPGLRTDKPWVASWSFLPRLYPPGDLLLVAPVAALYEWTNLSFTGANELLICLFLVFAHVGLFFALELVLNECKMQTPLMWFCLLLVYSEWIHWALEGFYDVAVATPLLLCAIYLRQRRALAAAVAYCAAAFIHFRALFFAPLSLYAVWLFFEHGQWRRFRGRDWLAVAAMLPMCAGTLVTLHMLEPAISSTHIDNPGYLPASTIGSPVIAVFLLVLFVAATTMIRAGAWVELAVMIWMAGMMLRLRLAFTWHVTILIVWLVMPVLRARPQSEEMVRGARLLMLACAAYFMFRNPMWPTWIELLWRATPSVAF